jgi:hypothetical protein
MKKMLGFVVIALLTSMTIAFAGESNYAGEAMSIGVGARPLGMGGAFCAVADDASTSYWNPAGMTQIKGVEVSSVKLTKINDLDTKYSYVNLVYNTGAYGAFGLGWLRQAIAGIKISSVDALGNPQTLNDLYENADNSINLAYAYEVTKGVSLGLTGKLLLGNYPAYVMSGTTTEPATVTYLGFGADLGFLINVSAFVQGFDLSIGLNVQDLYTTINWEKIEGITEGFSEQVGINLKPGIAYKLPIQQFKIVLASDLDTRYEQMVIHAGGEVWWNDMIGIRGGIKSWGKVPDQAFQQEADWSAGASLRWYFIGVDYTYVYNELTPIQYLSIIGRF